MIIDDEQLARSRLRRLLKKYETIQIIGEAQNGKEALRRIEELKPDALFLDIKMPLLSGFDMLGKLKKSPYIIFTTAHDEYALEAFKENTVDYLLKPIAENNLDRAIAKITAIFEQNRSVTYDLERLLNTLRQKRDFIRRFSVRTGDRISIVPSDRILFFHAEDKYTFLNTADSSFIVPFTLKELELSLDPDIFIRVHRSRIVNIDHIQSIHRWFGGRLKLKMKNGKEITVSQNYIYSFKEKIHV